MIAIFQALRFCRRKYGTRAIGVTLVRHCRGVDDVLAALLIARWAGLTSMDGSVPLDMAPAFESSDELKLAPALLEELLEDPVYKENLIARGSSQTVMLATSDAAGEGGVTASRWAMKRAHDALEQTFDKAGIDYTLFHGRGSVSGRGGVSDGIACGHLRTTEHGEAVNERYGVRGIAFRTLEKAFSAVAVATAELEKESADHDTWTRVVDSIAQTGRRCHDELNADSDSFSQYFRLATPVDVIEQMRDELKYGSGDQQLLERNTPWALAWAQSRHLLPSWFGFGSGLQTVIAEHGEATLRDMIAGWPFFRRLVNDVEIALAIADPGIAEHYSLLAGQKLHEQFFPRIETEFSLSVATVLQLREANVLLEKSNTLRRSIRLRNPYVDPMSLLQVELLQRWRDSNRDDEQLLTALVASVNGISRGLQTSA
jgi:phosphoenolpyruvate carboxylase